MSSRGETLLTLARAAIAGHLDIPFTAPDISNEAWLQQDSACFVTLHIDGRLRGCIGTLQAHRSLSEDVQHNAIHAAFNDPRFTPLSIDEFDLIDIEVSLLSEPKPIHFSSENDALRQLRPNIDGVIVRYHYRSATFLPQVWEQLPAAELFMQHLKQKAGLDSDFWADDIQLSCYQVEIFSELKKGEQP